MTEIDLYEKICDISSVLNDTEAYIQIEEIFKWNEMPINMDDFAEMLEDSIKEYLHEKLYDEM